MLPGKTKVPDCLCLGALTRQVSELVPVLSLCIEQTMVPFDELLSRIGCSSKKLKNCTFVLDRCGAVSTKVLYFKICITVSMRPECSHHVGIDEVAQGTLAKV